MQIPSKYQTKVATVKENGCKGNRAASRDKNNGHSRGKKTLGKLKPLLVIDKSANGNGDQKTSKTLVEFVDAAKLPTRFGEFIIAGFISLQDGKEHTAIIKGDVLGKSGCPLRVHSQCHTGDVFCSLRCDCREQLEASLKYIAQKPCGLLVYLKQEGRGIGLVNKIRAYHLQDLGLDIVEANQHLGFPEDMRDYEVAAQVVKLLGIRSVSLLTNNPQKIQDLTKYGIQVDKCIPLQVHPNPHNRYYLTTKAKKMGHLLDAL
jgi:GTP cyclohydrolase II